MPPTVLPDIGHVYVVHTTLTRPHPKDKIVVCVSGDHLPLFFWFNTAAQLHGIGQLVCGEADHAALTHDCFLDLSRVTTFSGPELATAQSRGPLSRDMLVRIRETLAAGVSTLTPRHVSLILENLDALLDAH